MNAQEMFERLGYRCSQGNRITSYENPEWEEMNIIFDTDSKEVAIGAYLVSIAEIKAICQQTKELGWLDES